ncbi:hypothetical protein TsFJ059_003600 [Trichoderma semiorbis]|uniref:Uncharacterized protein n=1 Tax=Trichoderma semiorbis TaxID=1491008 RepID=A0A9P8KRJ4_9HYPO|nr:hypothetical protein TsFJ059_003600 [Trichoderma semiorbis]KAH0528785.1 hypothetical protein TsFJ059_003600 [Trichoderma semiorbis]
MKPFYLTSILFISLGTALPVIHRDNNGVLDGLLAIVKDAVGGLIGALTDGTPNPPLNGDPAFEEAIFNAVKLVLGIEDPRSSEEIIAYLKEAGIETFDQIYQLLDTIARDVAAGLTLSTHLGNASSSHSISLKPASQLH